MVQVLIDRQNGLWCFADQQGNQIEYITMDKNGDHIKRDVIDLDLKTFLQQKEVEGFEQF